MSDTTPTQASSPPSPITRDDPRRFPQGLYIHLPFCAAMCTYCDFARELYSSARVRRYLAALDRELAWRVERLPGPFQPRTIFLGGGTPSALDIREWLEFFSVLRRRVDCSKVVEFTVEANPGSADGLKFELWREHGVNRISFGVQSFQPHLLQLLGRIHGAREGVAAVREARTAGFTNLSIDLMHGLPTQSRDDLARDLDAALELELPHLSAYGLIHEEGTPLTQAVERGQVARPSPEQEGELYSQVIRTLEAGGLPQYEISNFARPGRECLHNLIYWRNEAYLGAGVSAAGFLDFKRGVNREEPDAYLAAVESGEDPTGSSEILTPAHRARESLVLELRLRAGVDAGEFRARWGEDEESRAWMDRIWSKIFPEWERLELMERTASSRWRIPQDRLPVADGILSELL